MFSINVWVASYRVCITVTSSATTATEPCQILAHWIYIFGPDRFIGSVAIITSAFVRSQYTWVVCHRTGEISDDSNLMLTYQRMRPAHKTYSQIQKINRLKLLLLDRHIKIIPKTFGRVHNLTASVAKKTDIRRIRSCSIIRLLSIRYV